MTETARNARPLAARAARTPSGPVVALWAILALFLALGGRAGADRSTSAASPGRTISAAVRALGHDPPRVDAPRPYRLTPPEASAGRNAGGLAPHAPLAPPATPRTRWVAEDVVRPISPPRHRPGRPERPAYFANAPPAAHG